MLAGSYIYNTRAVFRDDSLRVQHSGVRVYLGFESAYYRVRYSFNCRESAGLDAEG